MFQYMHVGLPCFVIAYAFSFVWSCSFELPFAKLEKLITTMIIGSLMRRQTATTKVLSTNTEKANTIVFEASNKDQTPASFGIIKLPNGNAYKELDLSGFSRLPPYNAQNANFSVATISKNDQRF